MPTIPSPTTRIVLDAGADVCGTSATPEESWLVAPFASAISTSADILLAFAAILWAAEKGKGIVVEGAVVGSLILVKLTLPHSRYDGPLLGR